MRQVWIEPRAAYQVTRGAPLQFSLSANVPTVLPFCTAPLPLELLTSHLNDLYYIITKSYFSKYTDPLLGDICFEMFSPTMKLWLLGLPHLPFQTEPSERLCVGEVALYWAPYTDTRSDWILNWNSLYSISVTVDVVFTGNNLYAIVQAYDLPLHHNNEMA